MEQISLKTGKQGFYDITNEVRNALSHYPNASAVIVFSPHTTAGVTINENADPDVCSDMIIGLDTIVPELIAYRHFEGNTTAHLKASIMGSSATVIIENGALVLGTWQGIYLCEFDGPRNRKVYLKFI